MLTTNDIIKEGHPTLRRVADDVVLPPTLEDIATLDMMLEYLQNSQNPEISMQHDLRPGIGLAAPQINISKKMIAIHARDESGNLHSYKLLNPRIVSHSVERSYLTTGEGCLSVDREVPGLVPRYARVTVKAVNTEGEEVKLRLKGLIAIVFQHEIDHLNGVMFYDHIDQNNPFQPIEGAIPIER
ncbi:peptide deformylase [Sutcliffiella rhizosphaerae]|uniref:Peptide deformylase n=1 Tax=Sutcliffiella rhizosphaerae TaxID=2880967 RepID=A0ABN8A437_9BACI|nr:peptide deformylase [Sutcliffiella rhizosphaerae]CAG9619884.1 Peptide deformylase 2 [Sutcliffiella rhizosphaerae]